MRLSLLFDNFLFVQFLFDHNFFSVQILTSTKSICHNVKLEKFFCLRKKRTVLCIKKIFMNMLVKCVEKNL